MDFHQLRIFLAVARHRSFSRGAEAVFLSQPTVSGHVKALETELGVPLFDRSPPRLRLTEAGKRLLRYAEELLELQEEALAAVHEEARVLGGNLDLAASSVPGTYLVPDLLIAFRQAYPRTACSLRLRDTADVIDSVNEGLYAVGFAGEMPMPPGMVREELVMDELVGISCPGHPLQEIADCSNSPLPEVPLEEFLQYPLVMREPGSATRGSWEQHLNQAGYAVEQLPVAAVIEGQEAVKETVKGGLGLSVISLRAVAAERASGSLCLYRFAGLRLERRFFLVYRHSKLMSPLVETFLEFTRDFFAGKKHITDNSGPETG